MRDDMNMSYNKSRMAKLPRSDVQKQDFLTVIAKQFKKENTYTELEVNNIIQACSDDDHVLIRRELVNFGYLGKDTQRGVYWLIKNALSKEDLKKISRTESNIKKLV